MIRPASGALALQCLRRFLRLLLQRGSRLIHDRFECGFVGDGEIGENFAVQADAGRSESFRETAVRHAVGTRSSVEALNPKVTKSALARFAVAIRPVLSFHDRVFRITKKFRAASAIAFGFLYRSFAARPASRCVRSSWHDCFPREISSGPPRSASCCFVGCRSFRPRSLLHSAEAEQVERARGWKLTAEREMTTGFGKLRIPTFNIEREAQYRNNQTLR